MFEFDEGCIIGGGAGGGGSGVPAYSIDFEAGLTQSLSMSAANFGAFDRAKWGVSVWLEMESLTTGLIIGNEYGSPDRAFSLKHAADGTFDISTSSDGTTNTGRLLTTAAFTTLASFFHVMFHYDSANATPGDRMRLWIGGTEITAFDIDTNPSSAIFNSSTPIHIGEYGGSAYDGKKFQMAFFSGSLPAIGDVYNAGAPVDVTGLAGLYSLLDVAGGDVTNDAVLSANWTNSGGASASAVVP